MTNDRNFFKLIVAMWSIMRNKSMNYVDMTATSLNYRRSAYLDIALWKLTDAKQTRPPTSANMWNNEANQFSERGNLWKCAENSMAQKGPLSSVRGDVKLQWSLSYATAYNKSFSDIRILSYNRKNLSAENFALWNVLEKAKDRNSIQKSRNQKF